MSESTHRNNIHSIRCSLSGPTSGSSMRWDGVNLLWVYVHSRHRMFNIYIHISIYTYTALLHIYIYIYILYTYVCICIYIHGNMNIHNSNGIQYVLNQMLRLSISEQQQHPRETTELLRDGGLLSWALVLTLVAKTMSDHNLITRCCRFWVLGTKYFDTH